MTQRPIPAVLRIDIEPDDHKARSDKRLWSGLLETSKTVDQLRSQLSEITGHEFHPNWFFRFDPDMERCYGRADHAYHNHQALLDGIRDQGDAFGIHIHAHRWDDEKKVVFSDYADTEWTKHCLKTSCEVFKDCFGEFPVRSSQGGYFLSESLLEMSEELGIKVDMTPEPGVKPKIMDPSMGEYVTLPTPDYRNSPRKPYFPSKTAMHVPAATHDDARNLLLIPLTSFDYLNGIQSWPKRFIKKVLGRPRMHLPMSAWKDWPSPCVYWDLVMQAMNEMDNPYFATAIRTDGPETIVFKRAQSILEYLPHHPIAKRLKFVDCLSPEIRQLA